MKTLLMTLMLASLFSPVSYSSDESEVTIKYKRKTFQTNLYYGVSVKSPNGDIVFVRGRMGAAPNPWATLFCREQGYDVSVKFETTQVPYGELAGKTVLRATGFNFKETFIPLNAVDLIKGKRYNAAISISKGYKHPRNFNHLSEEVDQCIEHLLFMPKINKITCEKAIKL